MIQRGETDACERKTLRAKNKNHGSDVARKSPRSFTIAQKNKSRPGRLIRRPGLEENKAACRLLADHLNQNRCTVARN
jgi:hypothetical protein